MVFPDESAAHSLVARGDCPAGGDVCAPGCFLPGNHHQVTPFPEFDALGEVVEMKPGKKVFPPRDIVLSNHDAAVYEINRLEYTRRIISLLNPVIAEVENRPPFLRAVPHQKRVAVHVQVLSTHHADHAHQRVGLENIVDLAEKMDVPDKGVLVQVNLVFRCRLPHAGVVSGSHTVLVSHGTHLEVKPCFIQHMDVTATLIIKRLIINTGNKCYRFHLYVPSRRYKAWGHTSF